MQRDDVTGDAYQSGWWYDQRTTLVTTPHGERVHRPGIHPDAAIDPTANVDPTARVEAGATIGPHARIGAHVHIARDVTVGANSVVQDGAWIGTNTQLGPHAWVSHGATIEPHCTIGHHATIGAGSRIKQHAQIEPYSRLGAGTTTSSSPTPDEAIEASTSPTPVENIMRLDAESSDVFRCSACTDRIAAGGGPRVASGRRLSHSVSPLNGVLGHELVGGEAARPRRGVAAMHHVHPCRRSGPLVVARARRLAIGGDAPSSNDTPECGSEVPTAGVGYGATLAAAKAAIQAARSRAVLAANSELIGLYWELGRLILDRQAADGWGTKVIERFSSRPARRVPRDDGTVAHQPAVHAGLRRRLA